MKTYEYKLLDSGNYKKLEQLGPYKIIRPAPQAIWSPFDPSLWKSYDSEFVRTGESCGSWNKNPKKLLQGFNLRLNSITIESKLTDFGHIGFFPEHHIHTKTIEEFFSKTPSKNPQALNLFAHTGVLSLMLAQQNIKVTHVDSSKSSVQWAKKNSSLSKITEGSIRWITEDVLKFVNKEVRRKKIYDAIILDPPTYGRGDKNEVWKIEKDLVTLLSLLKKIINPKSSIIILSSHTPGMTPLSLQNLLQDKFGKNPSKITASESIIHNSKRNLPCGAHAILTT
jgi:23S rRNA (cytosine1962-C5)-methyltransferase